MIDNHELADLRLPDLEVVNSPSSRIPFARLVAQSVAKSQGVARRAHINDEKTVNVGPSVRTRDHQTEIAQITERAVGKRYNTVEFST